MMLNQGESRCDLSARLVSSLMGNASGSFVTLMSRLHNSCRGCWAVFCINVDHFNLFFINLGKYTFSLEIFQLNPFYMSGICNYWSPRWDVGSQKQRWEKTDVFFYLLLCMKTYYINVHLWLSLARPLKKKTLFGRLSFSYSKCESFCWFLYFFFLPSRLWCFLS